MEDDVDCLGRGLSIHSSHRTPVSSFVVESDVWYVQNTFVVGYLRLIWKRKDPYHLTILQFNFVPVVNQITCSVPVQSRSRRSESEITILRIHLNNRKPTKYDKRRNDAETNFCKKEEIDASFKFTHDPEAQHSILRVSPTLGMVG